jgi:hypothetical protein
MATFMRRFSCLFLFLILISIPSMNAQAEDNYLSVKPGIYSPQTDDLKGHHTGFNLTFGFGHQYSPNFAAEMEVGQFNAKLSDAQTPRVIPIAVSFKGIIPVGKLEIFGMGGAGDYLVEKIKGTFGFHLGAGLNLNISSMWFIGAEGKYLWTRNIVKDGPNLDGILATAFVGFRF